MNMKAEDVSNLGSEEANVDAIADLLVGDEDALEDEDTTDSKDEETQTDESTEGDDSDGADEGEEDEEEESESEDAEGETTWEGVLGVSEDKLSFDEDGNVKGIRVKVNGEVSEVPVNDLIVGYQTNKAVTQKGQALAEERKEFESQREEVAQTYQSKLNDVIMLNDYLEKQLVSEYDNIDWNKLRDEQPAEYAAARQDYAARAASLKQIREQSRTAMLDAQKEVVAKQNEGLTEYVKKQRGRMIENNPTWSDEKVFNTEIGKLRSFCSDQYGFTDEDFSIVRDARLIELIKDANAYRTGVKTAKQKIKKVVPKFQKSAGKPKKVSKLESLTKKAQNANGQNKRDLQADAIAELLIGG